MEVLFEVASLSCKLRSASAPVKEDLAFSVVVFNRASI